MATSKAKICLSRERGAPRQKPFRLFQVPGLDSIVVCGVTPSGPGTAEYLVARLLSILWPLNPSWGPRATPFPPRLKKDALGRPYLFSGTIKAPALSFSHCGGNTWAAMAGSGVLGIDVALSEEFPRGYPLGRAFGTAEFARALKLSAGNRALTAALLWSLKEAAVKAVGLGFHCFDPLEVEANFSATQCDGLLFQVRAGRPIGVRAFREGGGWLAVAYSPSSQITPSHHTGRPIGLDEDNHGLH